MQTDGDDGDPPSGELARLRAQVDELQRSLARSEAALRRSEELGTARGRTDETLLESNAFLASIIDSTSDLIWSFDADLRLLTFNRAYAEHFLRTRGLRVAAGLLPEDLLPPEFARRWREWYRRALEEGPYVIEYVTHDGSRALEISFNVVRREGAVVAGSAFGKDVTARRRAEDELRTLSRAVEQSPTSIVITDRAGNIEYANPQFEKVTGYSRAEVVGKNPRILKSDVTSPERYVELWKEISAGGEWRGELCNRRKNGELFWESAAISGLKDDAGVVAHYVAVKTEITDRKRAERERAELEAKYQQAQKMESIGRLAGGVAHDFNNMLGVILGNVELALEQVHASLPLHQDLEEIRLAATRSADLTRQLLAFARKQTVAPKVLDLNDTVASTLKMLQRLIGENVRLDLVADARLWAVRVDPAQIDQILANLSVNARDAIAGNGEVTIETGNCSFDDAHCASHPEVVPGDYVRLVFRDDGCGMDEATLVRIFEPFFTTKPAGAGTGLGLATVYGIVKQNHGFIDVRSELGRGTTFTIHLPRYATDAESTEQDDSTPPAPSGRETILLVEDEPGILRSTGRMLERLGYRVLAAGSPNAALRLAEQHGGALHLILTDVIMPEMNGRDLADALLASRPRLKRLFMSGYTADVIANRGVLDAGIDFIEKPFSRQRLAAKLREVLDADTAR
jgi:PAS domain S-box-containing protein